MDMASGVVIAGEGAEGAQVVMREDVLKSSGGFREELTGSAPLQHSSL